MSLTTFDLQTESKTHLSCKRQKESVTVINTNKTCTDWEYDSPQLDFVEHPLQMMKLLTLIPVCLKCVVVWDQHSDDTF